MKVITKRLIVKRLKMGIASGRNASRQKEQKLEMQPIQAIQIPVPYPVYQQPVFQQPLAQQQERKPKRVIEGIDVVPDANAARPRPAQGEEPEKLDLIYPLVPSSPKEGEVVFAYAAIRNSKNEKQARYHVLEPRLAEEDREVIRRVKKRLEEHLDVDISQIGRVEGDFLEGEIVKSIRSLEIKLDREREKRIIYYIKRDTVGFGKIEPLMHDRNIEDISCDGVGINIFVYHRDSRIGTVKTNIAFGSSDELDEFIVKLAQKCNKSISIADPLLDGTLPDGSRMQATLGSDIARRGSNFTIRKFASDPLTPTHMLKYKTLDSLSLAYLWLAVENNQSVLISGGTATGKTSMLNALSLFIRPNLKVVSIEDTSELRLPLQHWIPQVARNPLSANSKIGEVSLFDLLRASLRQRPDYIILGEVRGKEAFVLFQQMATGHASMATIHAATIPQLVDRLITPPINLPPRLLENIDIIIFLSLSRLKGVDVRRANTILEMVGVEDNRPITRDIFVWNPAKDELEPSEKSVILEKVARRAGLNDEDIKVEIARRKRVIEWMHENEIYDYRDVSRIIHTYYMDPERVMDMVTEPEPYTDGFIKIQVCHVWLMPVLEQAETVINIHRLI